MALKALMLRKKIDAKKADLALLREKAEGFETRAAELATAIGEASSDDDFAAVDGEINTLTEEREANEAAIKDLESEIAEMESDLTKEEEKQRNAGSSRQQRSADPEHNRQERGIAGMQYTAKRLRDMNIIERNALLEDQGVQTFITRIRAISGRRDAGSIGNENVLIPEVMLPYLRQIVEENSKMMKHFNHVPVAGSTRQIVDGGFTEAIWTEAYGRINELKLGYYDVELDNYKLAGFFRIPNALEEDSDFNLLIDVTDKLGKSIGYAYDKGGLYGTGTKMPLGIVTRMCQTSAPADYPQSARPWADLHTSNIVTVPQADSTGITLFQKLITAFGKTRNRFSRGGKWWAMNDSTFNTLLVEAMNINSAGNVYSGISPDSATMPVVGGQCEFLEFIPDNVIVAGYDGLYTMGERKGVTISQSEHVFFIDDALAVKGVARYDGKPVIAEGFVVIGINGVTPDAAMEFAPDDANAVTGIQLSAATATVKVGKTVQIKAKTLPVDAEVTFASSDETKATVSDKGVVTGVAAGEVTITAASGACNAVCAVTVTS